MQLSFLNDKIELKAPNVSQVPQYSPLRYPGGKTWLYPFAKLWLQNSKKFELFELFAGGASVGLAAGVENWVKHVTLIEKDENIAAIWLTIFHDNPEWLAQNILHFNLSVDNINALIDKSRYDTRYKALCALVLNRINHGGILAPGSGMLKKGENGKGIRSRWYPVTLAKRIMLLAKFRHKFTALHEDAFSIFEKQVSNQSAAFFVDPPYVKAAKRLYNHYQIDHCHVFQLAANVKGKALLTYDNTEEIVKLATQFNFQTCKILMQTTHLIKKYELLISKNFNWL